MNRFANKLQSKKFWLVVSVFSIVAIMYCVVAWVMKILTVIGDTTLVRLFEISGSVFETIIITYCAVNIIQKAMNGEGIIGNLIDKIKGK